MGGLRGRAGERSGPLLLTATVEDLAGGTRRESGAADGPGREARGGRVPSRASRHRAHSRKTGLLRGAVGPGVAVGFGVELPQE